MTREEAAKACPDSAAFIAAMREQFADLTVLYVRENGHTFGSLPAWRKEDEDRKAD